MKTDNNIHKTITGNTSNNKKMFAVLIDPDKQNTSDLLKTVTLCNKAQVDFFFVGGSLLTNGDLNKTVCFIKENSDIPVVLFPGSPNQITNYADGILFLSLISGRNSELLIGNQVIAAPYLKNSELEVLSTGYMLIDCGNTTTAIYMSGTAPIPYQKPDIAVATALAGEYLGMKLIYMDGGSGAQQNISPEMITQVKSTVTIPLIVGGGIKTPAIAQEIYNAGADIIVVGNAIEKREALIHEIAEIKSKFNQSSNKEVVNQ